MKKSIFLIPVAIVLFFTVVVVSCSSSKSTEPDPGDSDNGIQSFEWCFIPAGSFTYGKPDHHNNFEGTYGYIKNIDYDYEIMKYEVTNSQYLKYLRQAYQSGDIEVVLSDGVSGPLVYIEGYFEGDENQEEGVYRLYTLNSPIGEYNVSQIHYAEGDFYLVAPDGFSSDDYLDHPITNVTWYGAWHFADFYGWRIPTHKEWEKAARGMTGYIYPWGNEIDGTRANFYDSGDPFDNGTTPVGFFDGKNSIIVNGEVVSTKKSVSPYGLYDMAGNASNWVYDRWFDISSRHSRVVKGGSWDSILPTESWPPYLYPLQSWSWSLHYTGSGIRCVRNPGD